MFFKVFISLYILPMLSMHAFSQYQLENAFPNLAFTQPVDFQTAGNESGRNFVVEKQGIIRVFENNPQVNSSGVFLDIRDRVDDAGSEKGLLGLAFHPDYDTNGYFYVNYTANQPDRTVISRFSVSAADSNVAVPDSEYIILEFNQPYGNHNGGQVAFGPLDGYLYISVGDGGLYGDPDCNAQNLQTFLGSILRIDVDSETGTTRYAIPADNPFYGNSSGYREEIYAYGLRNPWRFSFDEPTQRLWAGDVGQGDWEEIDLIESGGNYGWSIFEGLHCYNSSWSCTPPCDSSGLIMPVWEYSHSVGGSITGGYVYRGSQVPELTGRYIYADYISGRIWALTYQQNQPPDNSLLIDTNLGIASFGTDSAGELYICAFDGHIYKFAATTAINEDPVKKIPREFRLQQNFPNPFNQATIFPFYLKRTGRAELAIYDIQGQKIASLGGSVLEPGYHTLRWDGKNPKGKPVASGRYLYQLIVDSRSSESRQLLLIR